MKNAKRILAFCLSLVLLVSCFSSIAASANAASLSAPNKPQISVKAQGCNWQVNWAGFGSYEYYRKTATASWSAVSGADGYEVRYTYNGSTSTRTVSSAKFEITVRDWAYFATSTIKIQVRAYEIVNGKRVYSDWSASRTVLI